MAGLILKSPYIRAGGAGKYMRYIATRENVERLPDGRPPTKKQTELISKLTRDFPASTKSNEYSEYTKSPTRAKASAYISSTLEVNWDAAQRSDVYMKYIATRPRVEKLGTHGLFGDEDDVNLDTAIAEMETVTGNVWTHIISLKREDAERLGYGYLNKRIKEKVDKIVDELETVPAVHECYMKWLDLQAEVDSYYKDERRKRLRLSEQKEFRSVKNAVIQEAERMRMGEVTDRNLWKRALQDDLGRGFV